jgi:hypothetical protein
MNHRKRLEMSLSGELPDRVPVAFWRHFPEDDQKGETLAAAHIPIILLDTDSVPKINSNFIV